jgi:tetratricopeptide (TPR) repeat protein
LRSVALAHDGAQNTEAVRMLERSVGLDATFAPAWSALGKRYYYEEEYGPGASGQMTRTEPALRRALSLDPNLEDAEQQIVTMDADRGKLAQAYQEAKSMVERHPQSGFAHFTLSYVLRYASVSQEAMDECEAALRLDPGNYQFRSCSGSFLFSGQPARARVFTQLDAGSEFSNHIEFSTLLREGKAAEALALIQKLPPSDFFHTRASEACYSPSHPADYEQLLAQVRKDAASFLDPEPRYSIALVYNHCLGKGFSIPLIRSAIQGGFCAYDYLRLDPLAAEIRKSPEYAALLEQAKQCHDKFLADRDKPIAP